MGLESWVYGQKGSMMFLALLAALIIQSEICVCNSIIPRDVLAATVGDEGTVSEVAFLNITFGKRHVLPTFTTHFQLPLAAQLFSLLLLNIFHLDAKWRPTIDQIATVCHS